MDVSLVTLSHWAGRRRLSLQARLCAGRRSFVSLLDGPSGQRTLREFVVAVQKGTRGEYAYLDYDAALMLTL